MMSNPFTRNHPVEIPYHRKIKLDIKRVIEVLDIDGINSKQVAKIMLRQTLEALDEQKD